MVTRNQNIRIAKKHIIVQKCCCRTSFKRFRDNIVVKFTVLLAATALLKVFSTYISSLCNQNFEILSNKENGALVLNSQKLFYNFMKLR